MRGWRGSALERKRREGESCAERERGRKGDTVSASAALASRGGAGSSNERADARATNRRSSCINETTRQYWQKRINMLVSGKRKMTQSCCTLIARDYLLSAGWLRAGEQAPRMTGQTPVQRTAAPALLAKTLILVIARHNLVQMGRVTGSTAYLS